MGVFKDTGHLFRFAGLFVLAFLVFLVVRHFVVPKSFGEYGHYRGAAIGEIAHIWLPGLVSSRAISSHAARIGGRGA